MNSLECNSPNNSKTKAVSKEIAERFFAKIKLYDPDFDHDSVVRAIDFAIEYHGSQKRHSGEPYYQHPVAVAESLADMKMDSCTIITALLHDTIEDTDATFEIIAKQFGENTAKLVEGVTKLTQITFQSDNQRQAENFRKLLVAISDDIRVLLVKLADRLHNMRTLQYIKKPEKRRRIAHETMEIYAALAERIGMQKIKDELQDIAFKELNPDGYKSVISRLEYLRKADTAIVDTIEEDLRKLLKKSGLLADVTGREKMPYSIWRKMQKKNITFEQLSDIIAFRVIVDKKEECYLALGIIHSAYHTIPGKFKDFISTPKNNDYQSIHTVVIGPQQHRIEIQIRTKNMNDISEMGVAAHWSYKQDRSYGIDGNQYRWIRELLFIIEQDSTPEEFIENTKLEMYHDQVFCFTPKGDLLALPKGATPVDFAFAVHSELGRSCVGAKINGRITPLRTQLKNGDQIDILRSKSQHPSPSWEHFVVTGKALSEIRRFIRSQKKQEYISLGKEMLKKALMGENEELHDSMLEPILKKFEKENVVDIYAALGSGTLSRNEIVKELFPEKIQKKERTSLLSRFRRKSKNAERISGFSVPIVGLIPGMAIHFAGCCHPLPGEKIIGIVNSGKGVTVHTVDCGELEQFIDNPERWIDIAWDKSTDEEVFVGRLSAVLSHQKGALGSLANIIARADGNINNVRIVNRKSDFFEIILDIEVHDVEHLTTIIAALRSQHDIISVDRYKEGA